MARVLFASPISDIRGKLGNFVFSANVSGSYVKRLTSPPNNQSQVQTEIRNKIALVNQAWKSLSYSQIEAWNTFAADPPEIDHNPFGEEVLLSGLSWHSRINVRRLVVGLEYEADAPASIAVPAPLSFGLEIFDSKYASREDIFSYTEHDFDGFYAILKCTFTLSPTPQSFSRSRYNVWTNEVVGASETDITTEIENVLGNLQTNQKIFGWLFKQSPEGIRSLPLTTTTLVLPEP